MSYVRVVLAQHRLELRILAILAAILIAAALVMAALLASLDLGPCMSANDLSQRCLEAGNTWGTIEIPAIAMSYGGEALVALVALVLGVQLVGKEVEQRTAMIAWTLSPSRRRWLVERVVIVGGTVLAVALLVGLALDILQAASDPLTPLDASFHHFEGRGWMVVTVAAIAFAAGTLCGAFVGRALPALLLGIAIALAAGGLAYAVAGPSATEVLALAPADLGAHVTDYGVIDTQNGNRVLSFDEANAIMPLPDPYSDPAFLARFTDVRLGIPGNQSRFVVGRMLGASLLASAIMLGGTSIVVSRRRVA